MLKLTWSFVSSHPQYSQELDRRKLLGQQYGRVLGTQLRILQSLEDKRQSHRIQFDALFKEALNTLEWIKTLQTRIGRSKDAAEIERYTRRYTISIQSHQLYITYFLLPQH